MKCSTKIITIGIMLITTSAALASYTIDGGVTTNVYARWAVGTELTIGHVDASNSLSILNRALVESGEGIIGELAGSDANAVRISGSGSLWDADSQVVVGNYGSFNTLTIENGGRLNSIGGIIGFDGISSNNIVTVRDSGSVWSNAAHLTVGEKGVNNRLNISNGGTVNSLDTYIGFGQQASNNTILVDGTGSLLDTSGNFHIGNTYNSTYGNSLTVTNSGKVIIGGTLYNNGSINLDDGWLKVAGTASLLSRFNYNADATLEVSGSASFSGTLAERNTFIVQGNSADWINDYWTTLSIGDALDGNTAVVSNGADVTVLDTILGGQATSSGNLLVISGDGSEFEVRTNLYVGFSGSDNQMSVLDGASATALTGYVGYASSASGNKVVVSGSNSTLIIGSDMFVGLNGGANNSIEVLDGGLGDFATLHIGNDGAVGNSGLASGSNTMLAASQLYVGHDSSGSSFAVSNGAFALSSLSFIGVGTNNSLNNTALVTGENSIWNAGILTIGSTNGIHANNTLTIENGGKVVAGSVALVDPAGNNIINLNQGGWLTVGSDFDADVTGLNWAALSTLEVRGVITNMNGTHDGTRTLIMSSGGLWTNDLTVTVGVNAASNTLKIVDGGMVDHSGAAVVGANAASSFNHVEISGEGSEWESFSHTLGLSGSDNMLVITNQGLLDVSTTIIGQNSSAARNHMLVTGAFSELDTFTIEVGDNGESNKLTVADGGRVSGSQIFIGRNAAGNQLLIAGEDSRLSSSVATLGESGSGNSLLITNGGFMNAQSTSVGEFVGANGNMIQVIDTDSILTNDVSLHLGRQGSSNSLHILSGATARNQVGYLGTHDGANDNMAVIDGSGSAWHNGVALYVGDSGSSNKVTLGNGGVVYSPLSYIGAHSTAVGNEVVVDGSSSTWHSSNSLFVGFNGSGNFLTISNGGSVVSGASRIGANGLANSNLVVVTDSNSLWQITDDLLVGNVASVGNRLIITNHASVTIGTDLLVLPNNFVNVESNGMLIVHGSVDFSSGLIMGSGGTINTYGAVTGLGGVLPGGQTLGLSGYGATWNETGDIRIESGATLDIGPNAQVVATSNYLQEAGATLRFGMEDSAGTPVHGSLSVGQVASFEQGANILYASNIGALSFDRIYTNELVTAGTLVVGGTTNATTFDLRMNLNNAGTLAQVSFFALDNNIYAMVNRTRLSDIITDPDLKSIVNEIDDRATNGDVPANRQLSLLDPVANEQKLKDLTQFYKRGVPTYAHAQGMLQGLKQINQRTSDLVVGTGSYTDPYGAFGPAVSDGKLRGWIGAHGSQLERDGESTFSGYDATSFGTVVGLDKIHENMVLGVAIGSVESSIDQDDSETSDATTTYGALYGTTHYGDIDINMIGSYGSSTIENDRNSSSLFTADADVDSSTMAFYVGATEESDYGPFTFSPLFAFQAVKYSQDAYEEVSDNAIGRSVNSYERWDFQSFVGGTLGTAKKLSNFNLITRISGTWQHEFNADSDRMYFNLIGGNTPHYFNIQAPEENSFDLGINMSALFSNNLEVGVGVNGRMSDEFTEVNYSGMLQYTF